MSGEEEHRGRLDDRPDLLERPLGPEHVVQPIGQAPRVEAVLEAS